MDKERLQEGPTLPDPDTILAKKDRAAIRYWNREGEEKLYRGHMHIDALRKIITDNNLPIVGLEAEAQFSKGIRSQDMGFVTESGRFVDREEAGKLLDKSEGHKLHTSDLDD